MISVFIHKNSFDLKIEKKRMSTTYIITGSPGSGKSTAAEKLASHFELGIHIQGDSIYNMVKGGYRYPWDDKDEFLMQTMFDAMAQIHKVYFQKGFIPVIDYVFSIEQLSYLISKLEGEISLTILLPDRLVNIERDKNRVWSIGKERVAFYHQYFSILKNQLSTHILDNSQMSIENVCSHILEKSPILSKDLCLEKIRF